MKQRAAVILLLMIVVTSYIQTIAGDDDILDTKAFHNQKTGESASDLLLDDVYRSLTIEIQYMPGYAPDAEAVANLRGFLYEHLQKPGGIRITTRQIASSADTVLSLDDVVAIERANRTAFAASDRLTLYILYANGYYTNSNIMGWAYRNTSAVIFAKKMVEQSGRRGKPARTKLETTVLLHELGHLLGLVNVSSPMQSPHRDGRHGKHCKNPRCLMYYKADNRYITGQLLKRDIPRLDEACLRDLSHLRRNEPAHTVIIPVSLPSEKVGHKMNDTLSRRPVPVQDSTTKPPDHLYP
jgi:predicted Zn-dependent protease